MSNFKSILGGICAPQGFYAAGVHCGIRHNHAKKDLALIKASVRCAGAGCYTTNKVYGAPITVDREHLADGYAQAIVVNSGNANTCCLLYTSDAADDMQCVDLGGRRYLHQRHRAAAGVRPVGCRNR